jgi:ParB-like chromosome segregation protein Spo0J
MKLEEFFNRPGETKKNDPLLDLVKNLNNKRARLVELRRQSQGYLIPNTKAGKTAMVIDPDMMDEAETVAKEIDITRKDIADLEHKIKAVDAIISKYSIERPVLREMVGEVNAMRNSLLKSKAATVGTLGQMMIALGDEDAAREHPKYLKALEDHNRKLAKTEPRIAKWEAAIVEFKAVL